MGRPVAAWRKRVAIFGTGRRFFSSPKRLAQLRAQILFCIIGPGGAAP